MGSGSIADGAKSDDAVASLYSDTAELRNAEEWLLQADYTASKRSPLRQAATARLEAIKDILIELLPDVDAIRFPPPAEVDDKPRVEFHTPYGWVPIKRLGLGYGSLIAWMVDLATRLFERYPKSANPIAEPAVVLVDELDLHLHPRWQRSIMSYLSARFVNTQFIVTAHSPLVVQAAHDANIAVLRREGDHVVIDQSISAVRGWRVDQVLTSDIFGLDSARPPEFDASLAARKKLLTKARLTAADKKRLEKIEAEIGELPAGESLEDWEAMRLIGEAASHLKKAGD